MTTNSTIVAAMSAAMILIGACSTETQPDDQAERTRIGKADLVGSCLDSDCDGPSPVGNCWCDEACESYGDCCEDEPIVCRATQCGGFAGLPCPAGLECIDYPFDDCDNEHGGADCGGVCVEPTVRHCGGFAGLTCDDDEFCAYAAEDNCGFADATGVCTPRPEACIALYDPVCGCNGQTYSNSCYAASAGVSVKTPGECSSVNACDTAGGVCLTSAVDCPADTVSISASCGDAALQCCKPAVFPPPPPASNSCVGHCGGQSADATCWCDTACETYGDCCADHGDAC